MSRSSKIFHEEHYIIYLKNDFVKNIFAIVYPKILHFVIFGRSIFSGKTTTAA